MTPKLKTLVLVPTSGEFDLLVNNSQRANASNTHLCGFGPIVSAAAAARLLTELKPERVVLAGIAGAYHKSMRPGTAYSFGAVACFGIGIGSGKDYVSAERADWPQLNSVDDSLPRYDVIPLKHGGGVSGCDRLLTCTTCSADMADVEYRKKWFREAAAEDMEGFSVAAACLFAGVSLTIIRGISNYSGDRDKANWVVKDAMEAVAGAVDTFLDS